MESNRNTIEKHIFSDKNAKYRIESKKLNNFYKDFKVESSSRKLNLFEKLELLA